MTGILWPFSLPVPLLHPEYRPEKERRVLCEIIIQLRGQEVREQGYYDVVKLTGPNNPCSCFDNY